MGLKFTKMHGLGNDFMVLNLVSQRFELKPELIRDWADRHTGVGFDQLLVLEPPTDPQADFWFRIYNADGSEARHCGNGARCIARFILEEGLGRKHDYLLQKLGSDIRVTFQPPEQAEVDMGIPDLDPAAVPFLTEAPSLSYDVSVGATQVNLTPVSMANPHAVIFVENVSEAPVAEWGAALTTHPRFPEGANIGFCQVVDDQFIRLRVFERGVGETRACGSGACAAVVAGRLHERLAERVKVSLPGGKVRVRWPGPGGMVTMSGPTATVYEGYLTT